MEAFLRSSTPELVQLGLIDEDWSAFYCGHQPPTPGPSVHQAIGFYPPYDNPNNVQLGLHNSWPACNHAHLSPWPLVTPAPDGTQLPWTLGQETYPALRQDSESYCGTEATGISPVDSSAGQDPAENGPPVAYALLPKKQLRRGRMKRTPPIPNQSPLRCRTILPNPAQLAAQHSEDAESNGPKKKRKYSEEGKAKVNEVRRLGACYRCRKLKKPCTGQLPCPSCVDRDKKRLWRGPCTRIDLNDLSIYSTDQWSSLLQSITTLQHDQSWSDEFMTWKVRGGNGPVLKFQLRGIQSDYLCSNFVGGMSNVPTLAQFALVPKDDKTSVPFSAEDFDAFVDGILHEIPSRIFVTFLACLLQKIVDYAVETKDTLLALALRYYGYCRLAHGFLRGLCYEGYHGGVGVGVWLRKIFKWDEISILLKMQLLQFTSERAKALEKRLFETVQARLTVAKKQEAFVPTLLALSILVDQLDCNIHEGIWLEKPAVNMVCPQKTAILGDIPTERLGHALTERASELANAAVNFSHLVTDRVLPDDFIPSAKKQPTSDQEFLLTLRRVLRGPRHHLPRTNPVFLERVIFSDSILKSQSSPSFTLCTASSTHDQTTIHSPSATLASTKPHADCDHHHGLTHPPASTLSSSATCSTNTCNHPNAEANDEMDTDDAAHINETCSCVESLLKRSIRDGEDVTDLLLRLNNVPLSSSTYTLSRSNSPSPFPPSSSTTSSSSSAVSSSRKPKSRITKAQPTTSSSSSTFTSTSTSSHSSTNVSLFRPNWAWPLISTIPAPTTTTSATRDTSSTTSPTFPELGLNLASGPGYGPGYGPGPGPGSGLGVGYGYGFGLNSCNCRRYDYLHNWTFEPEADCVRCEKMVKWRGQLVCFGRLEGEGPLSRFLAVPQ
ncbi:hypothetical protein L228DRAFT_282033 [Xylona heveae TC161]|uniref:Uncharacterized protein n=1 Tax=Xylona heveae (strain CBS 132557 / TC161) TaxID=1328760 RepID=A0A165HCG3_XYLHT|nr:hypothetical protein L228DRAFT_282033 [Xylona heveae TC161]KZF23295.1 hypothetical protein L228DRAFT_282033 [Xylona heveae TC161]